MKTFKGVGIQHKNGRIYLADAWERRNYGLEEALGIAVGDGEYSLLLYKNLKNNLAWSSNNWYLIPNVCIMHDTYSAGNDFNGKENTDAVLKAVEDDLIEDAPAFQWVRKTYGPGAYLPAAGELIMIAENKNEIADCSDLIGGNLKTMFDEDFWFPWSSTQYSVGTAWYWDSYDNRLNYGHKCSNHRLNYALACSSL